VRTVGTVNIRKLGMRVSSMCSLNTYKLAIPRVAGGAKTFVATPIGADKRVLGFYSLSPASIDYARTPALVKKGLARYDAPVFRLGRLAVDKTVQDHGLGGQLLLVAGRRCILAASEIGGVALLIDAKNERMAAWYKAYGALPLLDAPQSLLLPLSTVEVALKEVGKS